MFVNAIILEIHAKNVKYQKFACNEICYSSDIFNHRKCSCLFFALSIFFFRVPSTWTRPTIFHYNRNEWVKHLEWLDFYGSETETKSRTLKNWCATTKKREISKKRNQNNSKCLVWTKYLALSGIQKVKFFVRLLLFSFVLFQSKGMWLGISKRNWVAFIKSTAKSI